MLFIKDNTPEGKNHVEDQDDKKVYSLQSASFHHHDEKEKCNLYLI